MSSASLDLLLDSDPDHDFQEISPSLVDYILVVVSVFIESAANLRKDFQFD